MISMREPTADERAAFHARMTGQINTVVMLFEAAVELSRCYTRAAAVRRCGRDLTLADMRETEKAEERWIESKRIARELARHDRTKPSGTSS
jgi:hypothetical protein